MRILRFFAVFAAQNDDIWRGLAIFSQPLRMTERSRTMAPSLIAGTCRGARAARGHPDRAVRSAALPSRPDSADHGSGSRRDAHGSAARAVHAAGARLDRRAGTAAVGAGVRLPFLRPEKKLPDR